MKLLQSLLYLGPFLGTNVLSLALPIRTSVSEPLAIQCPPTKGQITRTDTEICTVPSVEPWKRDTSSFKASSLWPRAGGEPGAEAGGARGEGADGGADGEGAQGEGAQGEGAQAEGAQAEGAQGGGARSQGPSGDGGGTAVDPAVSKVVGLPQLSTEDQQYLSALVTYFRSHVSQGKTLLWSGSPAEPALKDEATMHALMEDMRIYPSNIGGDAPPASNFGSLGDRTDFESAGFALASSGKVQVMLPKQGLNGQGVFTQVEWPNLFSDGNGRVTEVEWVNFENPSDTITIWKTGDAVRAFPLNTPMQNIRG